MDSIIEYNPFVVVCWLSSLVCLSCVYIMPKNSNYIQFPHLLFLCKQTLFITSKLISLFTTFFFTPLHRFLPLPQTSCRHTKTLVVNPQTLQLYFHQLRLSTFPQLSCSPRLEFLMHVLFQSCWYHIFLKHLTYPWKNLCLNFIHWLSVSVNNQFALVIYFSFM